MGHGGDKAGIRFARGRVELPRINRSFLCQRLSLEGVVVTARAVFRQSPGHQSPMHPVSFFRQAHRVRGQFGGASQIIRAHRLRQQQATLGRPLGN